MGLLILLPFAAVASLVFPDDAGTGWRWLFLILALGAFTTAGFVAGGRRRDIPMVHGSLAAFATFLVAQLVGVVVLVAQGEDVSLVAVVVGAIVAVTCGVAGALAADWRARRRSRAPGGAWSRP